MSLIRTCQTGGLLGSIESCIANEHGELAQRIEIAVPHGVAVDNRALATQDSIVASEVPHLSKGKKRILLAPARTRFSLEATDWRNRVYSFQSVRFFPLLSGRYRCHSVCGLVDLLVCFLEQISFGMLGTSMPVPLRVPRLSYRFSSCS